MKRRTTKAFMDNDHQNEWEQDFKNAITGCIIRPAILLLIFLMLWLGGKLLLI
ncbi:MAG: hypothetical protein RJQ09_21435 [Cyclobacteriaceae bacterium]